NPDILNKWVDKCNFSLFSTPEIRFLSAFLLNPEGFPNIVNLYILGNEAVTLMLDGHDTRIDWNDETDVTKWKQNEFFSYKLGRAGVRTKSLIDINGFGI